MTTTTTTLKTTTTITTTIIGTTSTTTITTPSPFIRSIEKEGLLWGKAERKPIAYGIFKLTISAVVEDDKISVDWMEEKICEFEDFVQSVDIAAFQKI